MSEVAEGESSKSLKSVAIVATVVGTSFLNSFFSGALTSSLPTLGVDLHYTAAGLTWPVSLNALMLGAFLLPFGRVADIVGHRKVFLGGTFWFALFSLAVALAPDSKGFSALCALLGLGAAANVPAGVGILGSHFPPGPTKNKAFASLGAGQPLGYIGGLVIGAIFTTTKVGWRASFYVQAALSVLFLILGFFTIPSSFAVDPASIPLTEVTAPPEDADAESTHTLFLDLSDNKKIDYIGAILSISGLVLLTFSIADASAEPKGWKTPWLPPLVPIAVLILAGFFYWESLVSKRLAAFYSAPKDARSKSPPPPPLLTPSIWKAPHLGEILVLVFFAWASFNTSTYFINLLLQLVMDVPPLKTALYFLPMIVSGTLLNFVPGFLLGHVDAKAFVVASMLLSFVSPILLGIVDINSSYWHYIFPMMLTAPATDLIFSVATVQISRSVSRSEQATAGALFNVTTRLATSLSLAVISSIANVVSTRYLNSHPFDASLKAQTADSSEVLLEGYRIAAWLCVACVGVSTAVAVVGLRGIGVVGKKETKAE